MDLVVARGCNRDAAAEVFDAFTAEDLVLVDKSIEPFVQHITAGVKHHHGVE